MPNQSMCWLGYVIALLLLATTTTTSTADIISPAVDGSIRDGVGAPKDGNPDFVLDGSIVQALDTPLQAERGIIEFSLSGLSQPITDARLVLSVFASTGPFPFTIDVFTYTGDGVLTLSDWMEGSLFTSFSYAGEQIITLDVTSFIDSAVAAGHLFAGFNFRFAVPSPILRNGPFVAFDSLEFPPAASLMVNEPSRLISIDIKPGSFPNSINPKSKGKIPVAILTTDSFDATTVDSTTVLFGATGTEAAPVHSALEDVDGDRDTDMILHFKTQETDIVCGDTSASLTGETFSGQMIEGADSIRTVGCK